MANILFSIDNILRGTTVPRSPDINVCDDEDPPTTPPDTLPDRPKSRHKSGSPTSSSEGLSDQSLDENRNPKTGGGKSKKPRTTFTADQIIVLEETYVHRRYLPAGERRRLAARLRLADQQVKTWFQNRRMKEKRTFAGSDIHPASAHMPNLHVAVHPSPLAGIDTDFRIHLPSSMHAQPTLSLAPPTSTSDSIPWTSTFPPSDFRQMNPLAMHTSENSCSSLLLPSLPPTPTILTPIALRPRQLYLP